MQMHEQYKEFVKLLIARTEERKLIWKKKLTDWFRTEIYNGYCYTIERNFAAGYILTIKVFHASGALVLELMVPSVDREDYNLVLKLFELVYQLVMVVPTIVEITDSLKKLLNEH